ncbi:nitroreductase [Aggregatimonas sangjinii]|uniref:Nitroreductase n=1 Tax=Aggregatimonas sangjinii TaxID=2583587 RepID=A0A5B7SYJ1_9FLAO|nr:nitroreductase family protein [Aggregatimonas sangjinii]QCX01981.1 nitroreductase [Aggregatimonas sangjinii]
METVSQKQKKAETAFEILAPLKSRWSPRVFDEKPIPQNEINRLFEAARWAASSYNRQPWRFIYAKKGSKAYDKMIDCMSEFNQKWAKNAPLLIFTAYKEKTDEGDDNFHALHDLGLSLGNMSMQAESMNIAMHHMAGIDWKKAQNVFDVPEGFHVTTAIALGYYGGDLNKLPEDLREQETGERERKPHSEFVFEGSWKDRS